jgi:heat shock protein HtpX
LVALLGLAAAPRLSTRGLLRSRALRPIERRDAPGLVAALETLAGRAGLASTPRLLVRPAATPEAFAAGEGEGAVIVVTTGLLRLLSPAELAGVLAHELLHVRGGDLALTRVASVAFSLTRSLASVGWLALLLTLPLAALGISPFPWWSALIIALAPTLAGAAFLALSRVRELDADAGAAALTGDPRALASALLRIESLARPAFAFLPAGARLPEPPVWLRTHPPTRERVARLLRLAQPGPWALVDDRARPEPRPRHSRPRPRIDFA